MRASDHSWDDHVGIPTWTRCLAVSALQPKGDRVTFLSLTPHMHDRHSEPWPLLFPAERFQGISGGDSATLVSL